MVAKWFRRSKRWLLLFFMVLLVIARVVMRMPKGARYQQHEQQLLRQRDLNQRGLKGK